MNSQTNFNPAPSDEDVKILKQIYGDFDTYYKSQEDYIAVSISQNDCIVSCLGEEFQPIINARFFFTKENNCKTIQVKDNAMMPETGKLILIQNKLKLISGYFGYGKNWGYVRIKAKKLEEAPVNETVLGVIQTKSSVIFLGFDPNTHKILFGDIFSGEQSAEIFNVLSAHLAAPLQTEETKDIVEKSETANPVMDE